MTDYTTHETHGGGLCLPPTAPASSVFSPLLICAAASLAALQRRAIPPASHCMGPSAGTSGGLCEDAPQRLPAFAA
jgi:hypothetical protein